MTHFFNNIFKFFIYSFTNGHNVGRETSFYNKKEKEMNNSDFLNLSDEDKDKISNNTIRNINDYWNSICKMLGIIIMFLSPWILNTCKLIVRKYKSLKITARTTDEQNETNNVIFNITKGK